MKKQSYLIGLAAITVVSMIPLNGAPLWAKAIDAGNHLTQNVLKQPKVDLQLTADKQVIQTDAQGKATITWKAITTGNAVVKPGEILRYHVKGENKGDRAAQDLAVIQPIPAGTVYLLNSATVAASDRSSITYSIDNGQTFVAKPTVKVTLPNGQVEERPAPADAYTHVRWSFNAGLEPKTAVEADYQVKVRSYRG